MSIRYTDPQIQRVSLGNGRFLLGSPLSDFGPIKGNAMIDITRKVLMFKAGIPQLDYKHIVTDEDVFFKATMASLDLFMVQSVLGIGNFTKVTAGVIPVSNQMIQFDDFDLYGGPVNETRGVLLGNDNVLSSPAPVVQNQSGSVTYVLGTDYTFDFANGMVTRIFSGAIGPTDIVRVSYSYTALANAELYTFGGLNGVDFQPARFIHTRPDNKRIVADIYRASTNGKLDLEFRETEWNLFDFQFHCLADLTRTDGNLYFQLRREKSANETDV